MLDITKTNELSFYNDQGILTLHAKQYDTGRKFIFNIINDNEPYALDNCSVYLRMLKADNTQFQGEDCCTIEGDKIIVDTSVGNGGQILSCAGMNTCELHLTDNTSRKSITTWNFIIHVIPRVHNGDSIDSIDSWDAWDKMKESVDILEMEINKKAPLASPALTGTPTAPTASAGTNTTQLATTAFVQTAVSNGLAASDAIIIKGTIGTTGTITALPTTYKTGWTYRVVSAGTYAGQVCEIGDLIIALIDRDGSDNADSDWCVAQTNINGAITGIKSGDAYLSTSQTGSVVTITHKDVTRTNTDSTAAPSHGGTFTAVKSVTSDSKGHVTGVDTETVTLPQNYTHPTTSGSKHIPSGGSSGQILKWSADGTAVWGDAGDTDAYVKKSGDTMNGALTLNHSNLNIKSSDNINSHINLKSETDGELQTYIYPAYISTNRVVPFTNGTRTSSLGNALEQWETGYINDLNTSSIINTNDITTDTVITNGIKVGNEIAIGTNNIVIGRKYFEVSTDVNVRINSIYPMSSTKISALGETVCPYNAVYAKHYYDASNGNAELIMSQYDDNNNISRTNWFSKCLAGTKNYYLIKFSNGLMIISGSVVVGQYTTAHVIFPISFINNLYSTVASAYIDDCMAEAVSARVLFQASSEVAFRTEGATAARSKLINEDGYAEHSDYISFTCIGRWK